MSTPSSPATEACRGEPGHPASTKIPPVRANHSPAERLVVEYRSTYLPSGSVFYICDRLDPEKPHYRGPFRRLASVTAVTEALSGGMPIVASLQSRGQAQVLAFDFDHAENMAFWQLPSVFSEMGGVSPQSVALLRSGRPGGAHVFLHLDRPIGREQARAVIRAARAHLAAHGQDVDKICPDRSEKSGIRLPLMINAKFAHLSERELNELGAVRASVLYDPVELRPVDHPLDRLLALPKVDAEELLRWAEQNDPSPSLDLGRPEVDAAEAGLAARHFPRLRPCIRTFLTEDLTTQGLRNKRLFAIATDLRRVNVQQHEIETILLDYYDRRYKVPRGTSREAHADEARKFAERAASKSILFNCRDIDTFEGYCDPSCSRLRQRSGVDALVFPAFSPAVGELTGKAATLLARYISVAATAQNAGHEFFFLSVEEARKDLCSRSTERRLTKELILKGFIEMVPLDSIPPEVLQANGHDIVLQSRVPRYFRLSSVAPCTPPPAEPRGVYR